MPRPHSTMRKTRDVLRLHFDEGLSLRQTASASMHPVWITPRNHPLRDSGRPSGLDKYLARYSGGERSGLVIARTLAILAKFGGL